MQALGSFTILLFDIDGVIRDVAGSYRRALQETVAHYSGWRPDASDIDRLKAEGSWNNDWDASLELLRRRGGQPGALLLRLAQADPVVAHWLQRWPASAASDLQPLLP